MPATYDYKIRTNYAADVPALRAAHKQLVQVPFTPSLPVRGYTKRTLFIDLDTMTIAEKTITDEMIDIFVGGRGFGLYYLWQAVTPQTKWNDPDNALIISPGPLAGNTQYAGSGKSIVVTLSPLTGIPIDCNVGGYFGPLVKFCGFDAVEIRGKARTDVVVVIDGPRSTITIEEAPEETPDSHIAAELFTHMYADNQKDMQNVAVVSAGKAAESAYMGCLNFSWYDPRRGAARLKQAGRGGRVRSRDKKTRRSSSAEMNPT
jgi:aldehyde:ferredoxin oxidoreductase